MVERFILPTEFKFLLRLKIFHIPTYKAPYCFRYRDAPGFSINNMVKNSGSSSEKECIMKAYEILKQQKAKGMKMNALERYFMLNPA